MRKQERVRLLIEQTHKDGSVTEEWRTYTVKISYDAWIQATRTNMLERNQRILDIQRESFPTLGEDPPASPRSKPLY